MSDKPHGPVSERFMRHHYGASGRPLGGEQRGIDISAVWLRAEGEYAVVLVERIDGKWYEVIREKMDGGPFSHICEASGLIEACKRKAESK